ncbi:hypothetical protein GCM10009826_17860 [Humibacillus xanthopallidus]
MPSLLTATSCPAAGRPAEAGFHAWAHSCRTDPVTTESPVAPVGPPDVGDALVAGLEAGVGVDGVVPHAATPSTNAAQRAVLLVSRRLMRCELTKVDMAGLLSSTAFRACPAARQSRWSSESDTSVLVGARP